MPLGPHFRDSRYISKICETLLISQRFLKFLREAQSLCSDFTTGTKTRLFFLFPCTKTVLCPEKAAAAEVITLNVITLKQVHDVTEPFFGVLLNFNTGKEHLLLLVLSVTIIFTKKQAEQFSFCIIPHNEPHRERIEELFSVNLNTGSVSSLTSDVDWFCGSRSLALNRMQTFIWAMGPVCNFSSRVQSLFKQVTYVSRSY